jgi:hypothetical protein
MTELATDIPCGEIQLSRVFRIQEPRSAHCRIDTINIDESRSEEHSPHVDVT